MFFYHSASHDRVLHDMLEVIHRHESIVVLTGGPGLGKTTLCRAAARELDRRMVTSIVFDTLIVGGVLMAIALIALTLVGAAGAAWVFRDDAARVLLQWLNVPPAPGGPVPSLAAARAHPCA